MSSTTLSVISMIALKVCRANACFLWARLVLDELETVYSNESILQVLESIPEGMVPYYERTIAASSRRLTVTELSQALWLDIGAQFGNAKSAVEALCGQLVLVDEKSGFMSTNTRGTLQVWDFESLDLLYHVATPATSFRILQFAPDGSSIIDVADSGTRKWTPAILIQRNIEEGQDVGSDAPDIAAIEGEHEMMRGERITALDAHPALPIDFIGKHGQVIAVDPGTGRTQIEMLYSHAHAALAKDISVSKTNVVASSDVSGIVQVRELVPIADGSKIQSSHRRTL
ncbi:hypothetical protein F5X96DRAFT_684526 [Biscogniauxia mediterranea]|nr:hypothetical protein F5X96DRAFT_684526 [Biscogniauxia mediterranea]